MRSTQSPGCRLSRSFRCRCLVQPHGTMSQQDGSPSLIYYGQLCRETKTASDDILTEHIPYKNVSGPHQGAEWIAAKEWAFLKRPHWPELGVPTGLRAEGGSNR